MIPCTTHNYIMQGLQIPTSGYVIWSTDCKLLANEMARTALMPKPLHDQPQKFGLRVSISFISIKSLSIL